MPTLTLENQNKINEILRLERPFEIDQVYACQKGSCQKIAFISDSGINAKGKRENLIKLEVSVVRVGIRYANLKANEGVELTHEINGEWLNEYLITNKGIERLRVYPGTLPNAKTKVYWILNGEIKTRQWIIDNNYLQDSYINRASDNRKCFDIRLENILAFGK